MPRSVEDQRAYRRARYADYKDLCASLGVPQKNGAEWSSHYRELRSGEERTTRLSRAELQAWWTERFSRDEIFALASAIDFLSTDRTAA